MTDPAASTAPTPPESASVAEDFIDIFVAPSKVYARRAKSSPMMPFLTVCVLLAALFFAGRGTLGPIIDSEVDARMTESMKKNPQLTPEMVEKGKSFATVGITVGGVIGVPIALLLLTLLVWVIARFIMGGTLSYGTTLLIVSFAWFPKILESVLNLVQGLVLDVTHMTSHYQLTLGVARLLDPATTSNKLMIVAGQFDVFALWSMALTIIGLIYAGKMQKNSAIITGVVIWLCAMLPALWS